MESRHRTSPSPTRVIGGGLVVLLVVGIWYVTLAPSRFGGPLTPVLVRGVSMQPTYVTGDLVLAYRAVPEVGEVIAYRHAEGATVIHRVVAVSNGGYVTQGDNVEAPDPWIVAPSDVLGTARLVVPGFAQRLSWVTTPGVSGVLAGAVAFLVVLVPAPSARRRKARATTRHGRRTITVASLVIAAMLAPVAGAAASLTLQAVPFTPLAFDAAGVCTYNVNSQNGCNGNGNGGGNGNGNGGQPPGRP